MQPLLQPAKSFLYPKSILILWHSFRDTSYYCELFTFRSACAYFRSC